VGFYALDFSQQAYVDLEALFIEPTFIGKGLGRILRQAALKNPVWVAQQNCVSTVILMPGSSTNAVALYR